MTTPKKPDLSHLPPRVRAIVEMPTRSGGKPQEMGELPTIDEHYLKQPTKPAEKR